MRLLLFSLVFAIYQDVSSQIFFHEDFENPLAFNSWEQQNASSPSIWEQGSAPLLSSNFWHIPSHTQFVVSNDDACNCDKSKDVIYSPFIFTDGQDSLLLSADVFFSGGFYAGLTEKAYVFYQIDTQKIYIDSISGSVDWKTYFIPFTIASSVDSIRIGFEYSDQGGWLFGLAFDNVRLEVSQLVDLSITEATIASLYVLGDRINPTITIQNFGYDTIQQANLSFLYGGNLYSQNTGQILPYDQVNISLSDTLIISALSLDSMLVWVKDSSMLDALVNNDSTSIHWSNLPVVNYQNVLLQSFTSSECIPCIDEQTNFYTILESESVNSDGSIFHIEYHTSYNNIEGAAFLTSNLALQTQYDQINLPYIIIQGQNEPIASDLFTISPAYSITQNQYTSLQLDNNYILTFDTMHAEIFVKSIIDIPSSDLRLHVAVVERTMLLDTNNYKNVIRLHLTGPDGISISSTMKADSSYVFTFNQTIEQSSMILSNSGHFSTIADNLCVISFVHDLSNGSIVQVSGDRWPVKIPEQSKINPNTLILYPNPSLNGKCTISNIPSFNQVSFIKLYDIHGIMVWSTQISKFQSNTEIDLPENSQGMYLVELIQADQRFIARLMIE